jgi:alkylation response protein AidB-like acyl-CoA dehydrogenase
VAAEKSAEAGLFHNENSGDRTRMSNGEQQPIGLMANDLSGRVDAVCERSRLATGSQRLAEDPNDVAEALAAFAQAGLLDLASFGVENSIVAAEDIRWMAQVAERLSRHCHDLASIYMVNAILGGALIAVAATKEQKAELLPRLRRGELQLAFAMTEPDAGSDAAGLKMTAARDGDDFVLRGEKVYTTGAATADWIITVARAEEHAASKRALSLFLVPKGAEGLTIEPMPKLAGGAHASCHLLLRDVRVPGSHVLGGSDRLGKAWDILRASGRLERLTVAAMSVGLASAIVDRAVAFAKSRQQFGQSIASYQAIQHKLVDMKMTETAMRLFVNEALAAVERGGEADAAISMAKCFCSEQLQTLVGDGMQVMGGRGYFEMEKMARYYREAPFMLYAGGTVEIQKLLIARSLGLT